MVERSGVVDEDVDRAHVLDGARHRGADLLAVGDVAADCKRPASHRADLLRRRLRADQALGTGDLRERAVGVGLLGQIRLDEEVGDHDVRPGAGERQCVGAAEAARAARHEGDAAREVDLQAHPRGMKISFAITSRWICDVPS